MHDLLISEIGVMLLEGVQHYHLHAIDFNDNTLELGLWAITIYCFYQAVLSKELVPWLFTGFFAALAMMTKYYTALLLLPLALLLFVTPEGRKNLTSPYLYFSFILFLLICTPHIVWLFHNNFITVHYAFNRVSSPPTWWNHIFYPVEFAWQMFEAFIPALIIYGLTLLGKKPRLAPESEKIRITSFNKIFILFAGLGPFVLTLLLSLLFGLKLRAGWGTPLLSLWGLILVAFLQPHMTPARFYRFLTIIFLVFTLFIIGYSTSLIRATSPSSANFPGQLIAQSVTRAWHEKYHTPLSYVAGPRWLAGNVALYSTDKPTVYMDWNREKTTWIDLQDLKKRGGVFVWDISDGDTLPPQVQQAFPNLTDQEIMHFPWMRNKNMPPVVIGILFHPPDPKPH